jgi:hypothetical protein
MKCRLSYAGFLAVFAFVMPSRALNEGGLGLQAGFSGILAVDDGEPSVFLLSSIDAAFGPGVMIHHGIGLERKYSSYARIVNSAGAGFLLHAGRFYLPLWAGGGVTSTRVWGHTLNRPFLGIGSGIRYRVGDLLGLGLGVEAGLYERAIWEERFVIGLYLIKDGHGNAKH